MEISAKDRQAATELASEIAFQQEEVGARSPLAPLLADWRAELRALLATTPA